MSPIAGAPPPRPGLVRRSTAVLLGVVVAVLLATSVFAVVMFVGKRDDHTIAKDRLAGAEQTATERAESLTAEQGKLEEAAKDRRDLDGKNNELRTCAEKGRAVINAARLSQEAFNAAFDEMVTACR